MPRFTVITRNGTALQIEGSTGHSLMEAIRDADMDELEALCGGACSCATCHVYVDANRIGQLQDMGPVEDELLDSSDHRSALSRLSCQIVISEILDGLRVTIAPAD